MSVHNPTNQGGRAQQREHRTGLPPNAVCRACEGSGCEKCRDGGVWRTLNCPVERIGTLGTERCQRCMWTGEPQPELLVARMQGLIDEARKACGVAPPPGLTLDEAVGWVRALRFVGALLIDSEI